MGVVNGSVNVSVLADDKRALWWREERKEKGAGRQ
jgi:hypothetical protein